MTTVAWIQRNDKIRIFNQRIVSPARKLRIPLNRRQHKFIKTSYFYKTTPIQAENYFFYQCLLDGEGAFDKDVFSHIFILNEKINSFYVENKGWRYWYG